jgi:3-oxoacyl-[acyl-carrier-protein] synthase-3
VYPRDLDKTYFSSDTGKLKQFFEVSGKIPFEAGFEKTGWKMEDVKRFFIHQVSMDICQKFIDISDVPKERVSIILDKYGNTASTSIPIAFSEAFENGEIRSGDKVVFV